jgi:HSP20 family molecular chaperone IbpA
MFGRIRCRHCGRKLKKVWNFCPYCGEHVEKKRLFSIFDEIEKEFERIDKMLGFKFPRFDKPVRGGGISITIRSGTGIQPEIHVKTSGEYKRLEPEIKKKLGIREGIREIEEKPEKKIKVIEEPETKIEKVGTKEIITIKLPGVKSEEDIEIKRLEQSIEVKAFAGEKTYFKLIPIPPNAIVNKNFKDEILKIEVER